MWCPYCGDEMRQGFVRLRGQWAAWPGVLAVNFEAGDDSGEGSELLPRTLFRSHERAAHCCVRCEAVLVEPKSGTYVPPPDATPTATDAAAVPAREEPAGGTEAGAGAEGRGEGADAPGPAGDGATGGGASGGGAAGGGAAGPVEGAIEARAGIAPGARGAAGGNGHTPGG